MVAVGGSFHYNRGEWGRRGRAEGGSRMERDYDALQVKEVKSLWESFGSSCFDSFCWRKPRFPRIIRSILTGI